MLRENTFNHVTAKKWVIYSMDSHQIVKGYKFRNKHEVASLSKLLTFYTAYDIVKQYYINIATFQLLALQTDSRVGGRKLAINPEDETIITL